MSEQTLYTIIGVAVIVYVIGVVVLYLNGKHCDDDMYQRHMEAECFMDSPRPLNEIEKFYRVERRMSNGIAILWPLALAVAIVLAVFVKGAGWVNGDLK